MTKTNGGLRGRSDGVLVRLDGLGGVDDEDQRGVERTVRCLTKSTLRGLRAGLALAANAKEPLGTEGVGVCGLWVTVTARGQGRLALTIDALVSGRAQAVWVLGAWVTIASLFKTSTAYAGLRS